MTRALLPAVVAAGCCLALSCAGGPPAPAPKLTLEPHTFEARDGTTVEAELGTFLVPENRTSVSERQIELSFVRFRSTNPSPGPPIVYLAGGPGGSGIDAAGGSRFPLFMAFREIADVIAFDQRGTGLSSPIEHEDCETTRPRPASRPLDHATLVELSLDAARECAAYWREHDVDLAAYNTVESADDLEDLRRALGAEKIRLWAISYGTHLALATIRRHPASIGRSILAGVEGPDHTVKLPGYSQRQLEALIALIEEDPAARARYPDFESTVKRVLDDLESNPVTMEFESPGDGEVSRVAVGRPEVERATIRMLRDPTTLVTVPAFYERLSRGDYLELGTAPDVDFEMEAMSEAMDAASGMSRERRRQFEEEDRTTAIGGGAQLDGAGMAEALGVPLLGDGFRQPVRSDLPVLFISGTLDGRTPPGNADEVLRGFPNGLHLVIENAGHSDGLFLSSPLIIEEMLRFMRGEPLQASRLTVAPPRFDSVRSVIAQPAAIAERYLGEYARQKTGDTWRVVSTGTARVLDAQGNAVVEGMGIQFRVGDNGFTLAPVSETSFYVPLPGMEQIDFTFKLGPGGDVLSLDFVNSAGESESLPRIDQAG